ncbi:MAG: hypothetical protein KC731_35180 [Myxococcales bacterium]|nr:hypothetical protein [Myxococcales bacterium]
MEHVARAEPVDATTAVTLASGLQMALSHAEAYPAATCSAVVPFLRQAMTSDDINVRSTCADFLEHGEDYDALGQVLNRGAARAIHDDLAADEVIANEHEFAFLKSKKLPLHAPHQERALARVTLELEDIVTSLDLAAETVDLLGCVRRRALLDEALARAAAEGSPVQTIRVIRNDPPAKLLETVISFSEAVIRASREPTPEDQDRLSHGIRLLPARAASYAIHLVFLEGDALRVFSALAEVLSAARSESELNRVLAELDGPTLRAARPLLHHLVNAETALEVTLSSAHGAEWQTTTVGEVREISPRLLRLLAKRLRANARQSVWLNRADVPQANTVELVLEVVSVIVEKGAVEASDIEELNSKRQIDYHRQAGRVLGLLDEDNFPTARAHAVHGLPRDEQLRLAAIYFEDSVVGRAWRAWAGKRWLTELDPDSSAAFLQECVVGLSGTTPRRRSSTLKKWAEVLAPHHYAVGHDG